MQERHIKTEEYTLLFNFYILLFSDTAGGIGKGCGCYVFGIWSILQWPVEWYHADILKDITFLEMISIALSVFLWDRVFKREKIAFHVDNLLKYQHDTTQLATVK
jgi:hypothetical protein